MNRACFRESIATCAGLIAVGIVYVISVIVICAPWVDLCATIYDPNINLPPGVYNGTDPMCNGYVLWEMRGSLRVIRGSMFRIAGARANVNTTFDFGSFAHFCTPAMRDAYDICELARASRLNGTITAYAIVIFALASTSAFIAYAGKYFVAPRLHMYIALASLTVANACALIGAIACIDQMVTIREFGRARVSSLFAFMLFAKLDEFALTLACLIAQIRELTHARASGAFLDEHVELREE